MAHAAELGSWARNLASVVPPVFDNCTGEVSRESEDRLLAGYRSALLDANLDRGMAALASATMEAPWVGGPLVWLGCLAIAAGDADSAAQLGTDAEALLRAWGTAWDKRLTLRRWLDLAVL
jgi:hypothetical protein